MKIHPFLLMLATLAALACTAPARAADIDRGLDFFSLSYVFSIPTQSTADFIGNETSYRGLGLEWDSPVGASNLLWGFSLRWLYFHDTEDQGTYTSGTTTATGRLYRSVDSFPMALHLKYLLASQDGRVLPFVGLGAGAIYGMKQLDIGAITHNAYGWQFMMAPEAGALFRISSDPANHSTSAFFNIRYDAGFGADGIGGISNLSFALGLGTSI